jgi:hypothetical protein
MPGSTTTPGHPGARDYALGRFAFRYTDSVGTRGQFSIVAQWLACTYPYRRFADILADACARLGADVVRYSFIVVDLHHLLLAGLPAHPCENAKVLGFRVRLYPSRVATKPIQLPLKGHKPQHKEQKRRTLADCSRAEQKSPIGESIMAKGQMRSNREVKKPKQAKKPQPATSPSGAPPIRIAPSVPATQKKH